MCGVVALLALIVLGCSAGTSSGGAPSPPMRVNLGVANGTTLAVTLFVNGVRFAEFQPHGPEPTIDIAALPVLPWTVEARSPSGRVLTSMRVEVGQVRTFTRPGGAIEPVATMGRVDISCGRLTIWAGDFTPSGPIPASPPGEPGDCEP